METAKVLFRWLKNKLASPTPESRWQVVVGTNELIVTDNDTVKSLILKSDLAALAIATDDSGPWGMDFWWLLFDHTKKLACRFPQGATGEQSAIDDFLTLPDFKHEEFCKASGCTRNAVFPVWKEQN